MVRTKLLLIISLLLGSYYLSYAEDIVVPNGDVNALIAAIQQTNMNGDASNTIILATDGQYTISRAFGQAPEGRGPIGLPVLGTITGGKTLVIEGNGAIIERATNAGAFRFFYIELGTTVFLNNLTLQNGLTTRRGGGAIYMKFQARLRTDGCKFIRNGTQYPGAQYGGAIYIDIECDTEINNTEFTENFGTGEGGCIYNVLSDLTVTNSRFVRNRTINNLAGRFIFVSGAAIFCDGANDNAKQKLEIRQCVFEDNEVGTDGRDQAGGACFLFLYNDQQLEMDRCTFRNNKSGTFGGALSLGTNPRGPTPTQNTFQRISNCLFVGNESKQGGAIWVDSDRGEFTNCTIADNRATEFGGAFSIFAQGAFEINHCTIVRNFAERGGGGIFTRSDIELNNSIIAFNTENTGFGVHGNCRNTYRGTNNIEFPDRQTDNPNFRYCTSGVMIADPNIGPLLDNGGPTETIGLLAGSPAIDAITAACPGPGLDSLDQRGVRRGDGINSGPGCDIGAFEVSSIGVEVNAPGNLQAISTGQNQVNLTWIDNSTGETGFLLQRSTGNPFNFSDLTFLNPDVEVYVDNSLEANTTYYYRIRAEGGSTASWSNLAGVTTFTDGACSNLSYLPVPLTSPDVVVGNGTAASCTPEAIQSALDQGGNIACDCGPDPITISISSQLNASVSGTVFDGGDLVTLDGGNASRILNIEEGIDFTLQNIRMINGRAPGTGGLFSESGGAILVGSGNTGLGGGEIRIINAEFDNNTISNINTAERGGGAIYTYRLRNLILSGCVFTNNTANVGGAIGGIGSQLTFINSTFEDNEAAGNEALLSGVGGAVYVDGIDLWDPSNTQNHVFEICGSIFNRNQAKHEGGAVFVVVSDSRKNQVTIDKSSFENNQLISTTDGRGGAIYHVEDDYLGNTDDPAQNLIITSSLFSANSCQRQGGAVWTLTGGGALLENNTFEGNQVLRLSQALGGALAISSAGYGGNFTLRNNTIANNASEHFAGGVFGAGGNTILVDNNIFSNNTSEFEFEGHQLAGPANYSGSANILFPKQRWNGSDDIFEPDTVSTLDPLLSPLSSNGGPTKTMALNLGSAAIDNPGIAASPGVDQRGLSAVGTRDIGAYEFGAIINSPPQINDFNPVSSPLSGVITINGLGFSGVTAVSFNNVFATNFTVIDDQTLIATVPNLATTGRICLSNSFGTGCSSEDLIINIPPPIVTSFDPTIGGAETEVEIIGSDLLGTIEVYFNDALASSFTASSNDTLRAIVPLNATDGPIRIVTTGGEVITTTDFTVLPGIVSFTPDRGGENTEVVITGTNLSATTDVQFNGVSASAINIDNSTTVRATVAAATPLGANPIAMVVGATNIDSGSDLFTIVPPPTITNFTPTIDTSGAVVTITGTNLSDLISVEFNGASTIDFIINSDTEVEVTVPIEATTGPITIIAAGGSASSLTDFTVLPTIVSVTPLVGGENTSVTIFGSNFVGTDVPGDVQFGTVNSQTVFEDSPTSVRAIVATGETGPITLTADDGVAVTDAIFTFVPPPTIDAMTPNIGMVGTPVKIYGDDLSETVNVRFGGAVLLDFGIDTTGVRDTILVDLPSNAVTGLVEVNTLGGTGSPGNFTVIPTIYDFNPKVAGAGAEITITGANLLKATNVRIGGISVVFTALNSTSVIVTIPNDPSITGQQITLTNNGQPIESATSNDVFTFVPEPTITGFAPTQGAVGTLVTVNGTNFVAGLTEVTFNGVNAPNVTVNNAGELVVTVPLGATRGNIQVTTPGGEAESASEFIVLPDPAVINGFNPTQGQIGTIVGINGDNFNTTSLVEFRNDTDDGWVTATFNVTSNTNLTAEVPLGAGDGPIRITTDNPAVITSAANFDVVPAPPPIINSFDPVSGTVGTEVTILGDDFTGVNDVQFNGISATSFVVVSDGKIRAVVPNTTTGVITLTKSRVPDPGDWTENTTDVFSIPFIWVSSSDTQWNNTINWSPTIVPNMADADVLVPNTGAIPTIANTENFLVRDIEVETGAGVNVNNGGTLEVGGVISNDGTFDVQGTLRLSGSSLQSLPASISTIASLAINNPANVQLEGGLDLSANLSLENGNLDLNGQEIDLGSSGEITGETEARRIFGEFGSILATRILATNPTILNDLQTGIDIGGMGAEVTIPGAAAPIQGLQIRRGHSPQGQLNTGIARYYDIDILGTLPADLNATLRFKYHDAELNGLSEFALLLHRFNLTINTWRSQRNTVVDEVNNVLTLVGIEQFSTWTAGVEDLPLPVSLQFFNGNRVSANEVLLQWQTSTEINNKGYKVLKSASGDNFETLTFIEGAINAQSINSYEWRDTDAPSAAFYRLVQVDVDNSENLGPIIFVPADQSIQEFKVFPNPAQDEVSLSFVNHPDPEEQIQFVMSRADGKEVMKMKGRLEDISQRLNAQLSTFGSGFYLIRVQTSHRVFQAKLIKE